jgi:hypothetical protein
MRKILLILILIIPLQLINCQNVSFDYHFGYGKYQLQNLKSFQIGMKELYSPLPIKEVTRFPEYFNYSSSIEYWFKSRHSLGINGLYYTTGGRNHLKDYSGEYKLDMNLTGYGIGLQYRTVWLSKGNFNLFTRFKIGGIFSRIRVTERLVINRIDSLKNSYVFKGRGLNFEPAFGISYSFWKRFCLDITMGYEFNSDGVLRKENNKNEKLMDTKGAAVVVNWTGARISAGVTIFLFKKKDTQQINKLNEITGMRYN